MVITLVGLSGCGKSHLAKRLANEKGFKYFGCDSLIAEKLSQLLGQKNLDSVTDVAKWMGEPWDDEYRQREADYLKLEAEVLQEVLEQLGEDGWGLSSDIVVDTTGSVIYLNDELLDALKARSRIIYLSIPTNEYPAMQEQYFSDPKPVIWGDVYKPLEGENREQTLRRCYPELIDFRAQKYSKLAEMTLVMDRDNRDRMSTRRLLQLAGAK